MTPNQYEPTKDSSAIKQLCPFSEKLDVKHKNAVCSLGAANAKHKAVGRGNVLC